jgi:hypothetical protein
LTDRAGIHELIIDGWRFKVVGDVINVSNLSVFQRKTVIGDYTRDSNPLLSTWVITDLSGGHGVQMLEEGTDAARYRFGVIDARRPRQITNAKLTTTIVSPNGEDACPLVMFNGSFYIAFGDALYTANSDSTGVVDTTHTLTAPPFSRRVAVYRGKLYIPLGSSFDTYDGATVANFTDFDAVAFCRWDRRLFGLDTDGQIWQTLDGTAWENLGDDALIDDGTTPRSMFAFYDRSDFPMPVVVTNSQLWAFDASGPVLYPTEVDWPIHNDMGLGADKWRGELYLAVAMGIFRYNGETQTAMGLDRDQGLPVQLRGKIVDLFGEYNNLFALVSGEGFIDETPEGLTFDTTDDDWYLPAASAVSSLHTFTGYGWHCLWTSEGAVGLPNWIGLQSTTATYAIWWGVGAAVNVMRSAVDFANARAIIEGGTGFFAETSYFETGEFDAGLTSYTKIANSVLVRTDAMADGCSIQVEYRRSSNDGYTVLGMVDNTTNDADEETLLSFGDEGLDFKTIEFRLTFTRPADNVSTAPIMNSMVFSYLKIIPNYHSFVAKLDLSSPWDGKEPAEMAAKIEELLSTPRFVQMNDGESTYRVRLSQANGSEIIGIGSDDMDITISLVEVPIDL